VRDYLAGQAGPGEHVDGRTPEATRDVAISAGQVPTHPPAATGQPAKASPAQLDPRSHRDRGKPTDPRAPRLPGPPGAQKAISFALHGEDLPAPGRSRLPHERSQAAGVPETSSPRQKCPGAGGHLVDHRSCTGGSRAGLPGDDLVAVAAIGVAGTLWRTPAGIVVEQIPDRIKIAGLQGSQDSSGERGVGASFTARDRRSAACLRCPAASRRVACGMRQPGQVFGIRWIFTKGFCRGMCQRPALPL
jgi:hypothetical protein